MKRLVLCDLPALVDTFATCDVSNVSPWLRENMLGKLKHLELDNDVSLTDEGSILPLWVFDL